MPAATRPTSGSVPWTGTPGMSRKRRPRAAPGVNSMRALARERLQMIFRRARGGEAKARGDLGARGRHAGRFHVAADPVEDLLLPRGEPRRLDVDGGGAEGHGLIPYVYSVPSL